MMQHSANGSGLMREYLRDRTIGCPVCGYNLRGAAGEQCPECGTRLELSLVSNDLRLGWWLVGVVSIALPLGFAAILGCTAAFGAWRSAFWAEADWWTFGALCILSLFYAALLITTIRRRPKFMRLSGVEQRVRAIGTLLVMAALQVACLYLFARFRAS